MNWAHAMDKIDTLSRGEIVGLQAVLKHTAVDYKRRIKNYPLNRMKKYRRYYLNLNRLEVDLRKVNLKLTQIHRINDS